MTPAAANPNPVSHLALAADLMASAERIAALADTNPSRMTTNTQHLADLSTAYSRAAANRIALAAAIADARS